jgi:hypothetical protein
MRVATALPWAVPRAAQQNRTASSNCVTVSSSTGRATEPNSLSIVSHYRPLHELVNRAIRLLFPSGVIKLSLRPDRLWGPPILLFNISTGSASSGIKKLRREVDGSPPSSQINAAIPLLPGFLYCVYRNSLIFCEYYFNQKVTKSGYRVR